MYQFCQCEKMYTTPTQKCVPNKKIRISGILSEEFTLPFHIVDIKLKINQTFKVLYIPLYCKTPFTIHLSKFTALGI